MTKIHVILSAGETYKDITELFQYTQLEFQRHLFPVFLTETFAKYTVENLLNCSVESSILEKVTLHIESGTVARKPS